MTADLFRSCFGVRCNFAFDGNSYGRVFGIARNRELLAERTRNVGIVVLYLDRAFFARFDGLILRAGRYRAAARRRATLNNQGRFARINECKFALGNPFKREFPEIVNNFLECYFRNIRGLALRWFLTNAVGYKKATGNYQHKNSFHDTVY
jgi:hypothetical protein